MTNKEDILYGKKLRKSHKPSPPPEGKQKVMEKYTKLVMKRLYGEDVHVFFTDDYYWSEGGVQISGMFRHKVIGPPLLGDYLTWAKDKKCSITFKGAVYGKDDLSDTAWYIIVHEVTHFEEGITSEMVAGYRELTHSKKFKKLLKRNFKKVDDLRKQFNKEVGWDEDFVYGGTKMGYYYVELIVNTNTEDAAEDGGYDEVMERIQFAMKGIDEDNVILTVRQATKKEIRDNIF